MKIEQLVTSLEVSQRIEELGFKQFESYFQWVIDEFPKKGRSYVSKTGDEIEPGNDRVDAYTVAELGNILKDIPSDILGKLPKELTGGIADADTFLHDLYNPDWQAKCIVYLVENKLITI